MAYAYRTLLLVSSWLLVGWSACTSTTVLPEIPLTHKGALLTRVDESDSTDTKALRDLGTLYMQQKDYAAAGPLLRRAYAQNPDEAQTGYYYGLYLEHADSLDKAQRLYARYRVLSKRILFRKPMAGRHEIVIRELVRRELALRIKEEETRSRIPVDSLIKPNTVAVFPLHFLKEDPLLPSSDSSRYARLGRGLSALIIYDLGHVRSLTVLERLQMQVLLDELKLAADTVLDLRMAARAGRLLRAEHVVTGVYDVSSDEQMSLHVVMQEVNDDERENLPMEMEDKLKHFFAVEKDLVFQLIASMGIRLSVVEREQIEKIPTRSLQALLAYSQGLELEDTGNFEAAAQAFRQAERLDPDFGAPTDRAEINEGLQQTGTTIDEAATNTDIPIILLEEDLIRIRHENLVGNLGSLVVPGQEKRDEPPGGDASVIPRPPEPPTPPGGN